MKINIRELKDKQILISTSIDKVHYDVSILRVSVVNSKTIKTKLCWYTIDSGNSILININKMDNMKSFNIHGLELNPIAFKDLVKSQLT